MVTFLPQDEPFARLTKGAGDVSDALAPFMQRRKEQKGRMAESEALQEAGYNVPAGVQNPKIREALLEQQGKQKKSEADLKTDQERTKTIGKYFGNEAAEIYPHLTEGGKTKLTEVLLEGKMRGTDMKNLLGNFVEQNPQAFEPSSFAEQSESAPISEMSPPTAKKTQSYKFQFPQIELPKNKTPKELDSFKKEIRKENVPLFQGSGEKSKALKNQEDHLNILEDLSPEIPDISRFLVNRHGQFRPIAQMIGLVPPKAERFLKTVKDFITGAKDIFGSRVTNFDIQAFEARLPSLLNSKEGRSQIIQQMKLFSEMERNYHEAIKNVYKHYGLDNITQEQAEQIAESMTKERESELRGQLSKIGGEQFDLNEMPDPSQNAGKTIVDDQGNRFKSNGTSWEPV